MDKWGERPNAFYGPSRRDNKTVERRRAALIRRRSGSRCARENKLTRRAIVGNASGHNTAAVVMFVAKKGLLPEPIRSTHSVRIRSIMLFEERRE